MTAADLARVDVPAAVVAAEAKRKAALARWNAGPDRLNELAARPAHDDIGEWLEYRHLLHDADPDSTVPAFRVDLTKKPTGGK